ncbi:CTLH/CRA C-terminal to lish motif domain-containing protein, partial [Dichotomocladium elegans]
RFKDDLSVISNPTAFANKDDLMRRALAIHFIRQGQFDLCDTFMNEAGINESNDLWQTIELLKKEFLRMHSILDSLDRQQNVDSAIEWAQAHHEELNKLGSNLEFDLHRLQFIQLLQQQKRMEAVIYGQTYFPAFADKHYMEIKRMMAAIIFSHKLETSPYRSLCSSTLWIKIREEFQHDFCALLNMSAESPLYTSVLVGTTALPVILKLYKIVSATKTEWSQQDELPVELPLSDDLRYHSVFACPVSKEQASETNPPMMMPCGHVICKESLISLSKSTNVRNAPRFKCPYCPVELSVDQAIQVYF